MRDIMADYIDVSKDILMGFKKKPVRSTCWMASGGVILACYRRCPNLTSYRNEVIEYSNELGLCANAARNNESKLYIDRISTILSDGCIKFVNLGVCSLVIEQPRSLRCHNYHNTCKHLQPRIWTFYYRIVDIGVWNEWLLLNKKMVDFDINQSEFSNSMKV